MMAAASGISVSSVQRIWRKHGLLPHRMRLFKLSNVIEVAAIKAEIVAARGRIPQAGAGSTRLRHAKLRRGKSPCPPVCLIMGFVVGRSQTGRRRPKPHASEDNI
jgi:hypothetical protein